MDFLSKIIKRPHSIATMSDAKASSDTTTTPVNSEISAATAGPAMDLENLLDSASQDLDTLEEQHEKLIDAVLGPDEMLAATKPPTPRETIKQLLCDINVNLDQVTTNEMEHLQAMSLELNPLAVKTTPRSSSMEQQKALVAAAMRATSQPGTPTANSSCDPLRFTGLPEFDETQIPELAPFGGDIEAQLKADSSALGRLNYHSDSDVYAECLSLESVKMSAEHSDMEAYSSALNEVLEQQSNCDLSTATTLENTLSEADAALAAASSVSSSVHDNSCEPMDVDDISETMEMLKDVLEPEDHRMLQQQFLGAAIDIVKQEETNSNELLSEPLQQQEEPQSPKVAMPALQQITSPPIPTHRPKTAEELSELMALQQFDLPEDEQKEIKPAKQEDEIQMQEDKPVEQEQEIGLPIEQEQETELLVQKEQEQVEQKKELPIEQLEEQSIKKETENITTQQENEEELVKEYVQLKHEVQPLTEDNLLTPVKPAEQQQQSDLTPLSLSISESTHGRGSAPSSPSFPIKHTAEGPSHFPRSPHAPPEQVEEVYLEEAVIEPSLDRKLSLGGVIARDPLPIELTITEPSPEKPQEQQQQQVLNETLPMSNGSPLNGTFHHASSEALEQPSISSAAFGVPLDASMDQKQQRRTFSLNFTREEEQHHQHSEDELPMNNTYAMPLNAAKDEQRRTFSLADQQQPDLDQVKPRRTFHLEQAQRHNPAVMESAEYEPMEVDLSLRVDAAADPSQFTPLSPPIPTHQVRAEPPSSPPIPTHQAKVRALPPSSPPLPTHQPKEQHQNIPSSPLPTHHSQEEPREMQSPPLPTHQLKVEEQKIQDTHSPPLPTHQRDTRSPPIPTLQQKQQLNRPSIHGDRLCPNATVVLEEQTLSAKEQLSASDEKDDVLVEHFGAMSPITDDIFKSPQFTSSVFNNLAKEKAIEIAAAAPKTADNEEEFQSGAIILNSSDFDYLYTKGHNNAPIDRSSLLLKFDPLLGAPVPVNHQQFQQQQQEQKLFNVLNGNNNNNNLPRALSPTLEEHETSGSNQSFVIEPTAKGGRSQAGAQLGNDFKFKPPVDRTKKHAKMSVDVIDNDCNKTFDNSNLNLEEKTHKYHNMDELEKKIKNEVTRSEDIEKKLKEAELREEALVKRITEKDKTNSKLNNVIEAYEKAIAELIHDKEQLVQDHEREMLEVQADRDSNYHHLTSLETTFSDLHVKYEKSKEMTSQLKKNEECLQEEKRKVMDKLRQQEQRYEQMRSHAMQQMEIANKKLATLTKDHTDEVKKLKALLKKEEVSRISTAEQLQQKSRENADLLKICEDLIYDKGQGGSS